MIRFNPKGNWTKQVNNSYKAACRRSFLDGFE